jgi:hypothetical protein
MNRTDHQVTDARNSETEEKDKQHSMTLHKKNSVVLSPLANYTDRAIAAGQRS